MLRIEHRTENGIELKRCCTCKRWLPLDCFTAGGANRWDGLDPRCHDCSRAKDRRLYRMDPEKHRAKTALWREEHPEKVREQWIRRYRENREAELARNRRWWKQHPEAQSRKLQKRAEQIKDAPGSTYTTDAHVSGRRALYGDLCYLCGEPADSIDHVIPLSKGGTHWPANLRPVCRRCNSIKGSTWPYDFDTHKRRINLENQT